MYRGFSASSARAPRIWLMEKLIPCSKSTKVDSLQRQRWISSRVTTAAACSARSKRTRNGCGCSFMRMPALRSSPVVACNSKGPKHRLGERGGEVGIHHQRTSIDQDSISFDGQRCDKSLLLQSQ